MDGIQSLGLALIQALQTQSPALDSFMKAISFFGTIEFYILFIPLIYWTINNQLGVRVLLVLIATDFFGVATKQLLRQPRPYWVGGVQGLGEETSYGIASTHASDSLAVWGYLAYRVNKAWLWVLSVVLILLIGVSRLYLGVHFPQDVLAGWLIGLVVIFLFVKGEPWALPRLKKLSTTGQIALGLGLSIAMLLTGRVIIALFASFPDPPAWAAYATQARQISHYFTLAGALFGTIAGFVLMRGHARFDTRGSLLQKALRYLVGMAGVIALYLALDAVFSLLAVDESLAGYVLRYLRYAAVTFWATFGAPWVFLKIKLARPALDEEDLAGGKAAEHQVIEQPAA